MVGGVETDGGDEGNNIGHHHMGVDDHFGHPYKDQWNHQIYHPEMGEVEAGDKGSSHPGWDGLEGLILIPVGVTRVRSFPLPAIDMTLSPKVILNIIPRWRVLNISSILIPIVPNILGGEGIMNSSSMWGFNSSQDEEVGGIQMRTLYSWMSGEWYTYCGVDVGHKG